MSGSWNVASGAYGKKNGWDDDDMTNKVMIVHAITITGTALGALFSGNIAFLGRRNCIIIANFVLIFGVCLTIVSEFGVLCTGKFIYGISIGAFSVFSPKFIAETAPIEVKGSAGALNQVQITVGVLIAFCLGLEIGEIDDDDIDSFEVQYYWYVLFLVPLIFSLIHLSLLTCVFTHDTPYFLK